MSQISRPKGQARERRILTEGELKEFLLAIQTDEEWAAVICFLHLNLRRLEVAKARFSDIKDDCIVVHGKEREGERNLLPEYREALLKLRSNRSIDDYIFERREKTTERSVGGRLYQTINKICDRAGITGDRRSPHTLRHTFANLWIEAGGDLLTLQKLLRHSDIRQTMHYAEQTRVQVRAAEAKVRPIQKLQEKFKSESNMIW